MSRSVLDQTAILVAVLDAEGYETGRAVYVHIDFAKHVDAQYGADADGRRGVLRVEYEPVEVFLDHRDLKTLTRAEVEQVRRDARASFDSAEKEHR